MDREGLKDSSRWVVKIGSSLLTNNGLGLKTETLDNWVSQIMTLRNAGKEVVLVSSGAVAEGINRLSLEKRPHSLHELQAVAAVGQMGLIQAYQSCFQKYHTHTAQILITHDEISNRGRYLNARSTLRTLLGMDVVPIVNENDTVATDEIQFGDNDTLAGLVSNLVEADLLVILTDQSGLFDKDPHKFDDAKLISYAEAGDKSLERYAGEVGRLGRGGMLTKLCAAEIAVKSGTTTIIANGADEEVLTRLNNGEDIGTLLGTKLGHVTARKQWLAGQSKLAGELVLDDGAAKVLKEGGRSLLAVGVVSAKGDFRRGEIVRCIDGQGSEIARGLVNYNIDETRKIMGQPSNQIEPILGYVGEDELIHLDNMVII